MAGEGGCDRGLRGRHGHLSGLGERHVRRRIPRTVQDPAATGAPRSPHRSCLDDVPHARPRGARAPRRRRVTCAVDRGRRHPDRRGLLAPTRLLRSVRPVRRRRRIVGIQPRLVRALRAQRVPARDCGRDADPVVPGRHGHLRAERHRYGALRRLGVPGGVRPCGRRVPRRLCSLRPDTCAVPASGPTVEEDGSMSH